MDGNAMDTMLTDLQKASSELSKSRAAMEAALQQSTPPATKAADSSLSTSEMLSSACISTKLSHHRALLWPLLQCSVAKPAETNCFWPFDNASSR